MTTGRLGAAALLVLSATGCWQQAERQMEERVAGMEGHLLELYDAAAAVQSDDAKGYREAMKALSATEDLPGVDPSMLAGVRTAAQAAASMKTPPQQAEGLVAVAGACVSCHSHLGTGAPSLRGVEGDALTLALTAYVWRDDALWTRAGEAAAGEGAPWPTANPPWPQRGGVITRLLTR